ncbi:MAG: hypothetical protein ACSHYF_01995 [Verrucomicrobiaceae bacterium]
MKLLCLILLSLLPPVHAQEKVKNAPCRCCQLNRVFAPYLKDLPPPILHKGIGTSSLKISTKSPEAQRWFNQGLCLLHAFWEFEAYRSFLQAAEADPDCAMAYWGIAMSLPGKLPESRVERNAALERALELSPKASPHEQAYITVLQSLINSGSTRAIENIRTLLKKFPDDPEAGGFLAYWLRDGFKDGKPGPGTSAGLEVLDEHLKRHPKHPGLHHYRIHLLEPGPDFATALDSALLLPEITPNAPHLVHMPGHIFHLQGDYHRAVLIFQLARRVEESYLKVQGIPPIDSPNYLHNLHFLVFSALESGEVDQALEAAVSFASIKIPEGRNQAIGSYQTNYLSQQLPALVHARMGNYGEAASLIDPEAHTDGTPPYFFLQGFKTYFEVRQLMAQTKEADRTALLKARLKFRQILRSYKAAKPIVDTVGESMPYETSMITLDLLDIELRAFFESPQADDDTLRSTMELASEKQNSLAYIEPPFLPWNVEEQFGNLWLQRKNKEEAAKWFRKSLKLRPKSGPALLGLARATGQKEDYRAFLESWQHADGDRPELTEAREFIANSQ